MALVTVVAREGPAEPLCARCADRLSDLEPDRLPPFLWRFYRHLARPASRDATCPSGDPAIEAGAVCPGCDLTLADLLSNGLAGCARCYVTHRAALASALNRLHSAFAGRLP